MHISKLVIENVRSFKGSNTLEFSKGINIFVGKNNSGKSTILRCIHLLQRYGSNLDHLRTFPRKFLNGCGVELHFNSPDARLNPAIAPYSFGNCATYIRYQISEAQVSHLVKINNTNTFTPVSANSIASTEPNNYLILYFSKRKSAPFEQKTDYQSSYTVHDTFKNLYARIAKLANSAHDAHGHFMEYTRRILGCAITMSHSSDGSEAGLWLNDANQIPVSAMGEGTASILAIIVELCLASDKAFLIEEIENDIHPEALKALLDLIILKSKNNQFFISTHSNIVLSRLATSRDAKIFSLEMRFEEKIPTTTISLVDSTPLARHKVLSELGYQLIDFGLWQGYLILEESTAQTIINSILIPYFCPGLQGKLLIIAANGVSCVEPVFDDFRRLMVFVHTSEIYRESSWVRVDGGEIGEKIIASLREKFPSISPDQFKCFKNPDFELYYPQQFKDEAMVALGASGQKKRDLKITLFRKVLDWAIADPLAAREQFAVSAKEIIEDLSAIAKVLCGQPT